MLLKELGLEWRAQLLTCVYAHYQDLKKKDRDLVVDDLRCLPILPLVDGRSVSLCLKQDGHLVPALPVFMPLECTTRSAAEEMLQSSCSQTAAEEAAGAESEPYAADVTGGVAGGTTRVAAGDDKKGSQVQASKAISATEQLLRRVGLSCNELKVQQLHPELLQVHLCTCV